MLGAGAKLCENMCLASKWINTILPRGALAKRDAAWKSRPPFGGVRCEMFSNTPPVQWFMLYVYGTHNAHTATP